MIRKLLDDVRIFISNLTRSRLYVIAVVMVLLFAILFFRLFDLQIINGEYYLNNFKYRIERERTLQGTRGNIYDSKDKVLAYNELAYNVTIEDSGSYQDMDEKNEKLNSMIYKLIQTIEKHGDKIDNNFGITISESGRYSFLYDEGVALQRFRADIYGYRTVDELTFNKKLNYNEADASPEQIIDFLAGEDMFDIKKDKYTPEELLKIIQIRYAMYQNTYQKYMETVIASEVSQETVAAVLENVDDYIGVDIKEATVRKYVDSKYFASILGYTGKISTDEYNELSKDNEDKYTLNDVIGKAGIEKSMEEYLQGEKGYQKIYVDNLGRQIEEIDYKEPGAGGDVYLTIDKDLQIATYNVIERKLADILCSKIINSYSYNPEDAAKASDIEIPICDVIYSLVENRIIDIEAFNKESSTDNEKNLYNVFKASYDEEISYMESILNDNTVVNYADYDSTTMDYVDYLMNDLISKGVLLKDKIDQNDDTYKEWKKGNMTIRDYLMYAVSSDWIDSSKFTVETKYSDSAEIYVELVGYILDSIKKNNEYEKLIYKNLIKNQVISGNNICAVLYEQKVLPEDEAMYQALLAGSVGAYDFLMDKIANLEITPGMLALDPCSASCVVTNPNTGEVLACVSYPGYDNNKLANSVDADYYSMLAQNKSLPLYNHATQETTAPGSTFKMITSAAALTEGIISLGEQITDEGEFKKVTPSPKCWIYPGNHGSINVSEAIRDSCNYFFYEVGYRMSTLSGEYDEEAGLSMMAKYAKMFGLDSVSGVEMIEAEPAISDAYPVASAIGQGTHAYTTTQLAKYVSTIANGGELNTLSILGKVVDADGNVVQEFKKNTESTLDDISSTTWGLINSGMRMVVDTLDAFKDFKTPVAGKTGTAEEVNDRGNHALFVGFAPYNNPEVAIATRIAYGYSSNNTVDIASNVLRYIFEEEGYEEIRDGTGIVTHSQDIGD